MGAGQYDRSKAKRPHKYKKQPLRERFERFFIPEPNTGCFLWIGGIENSGYGHFNQDRAHRKAYEIYNGPIPEGMCVCHKCDVKLCVNPKHLFLGTTKENVSDKCVKMRHNFGIKHPMCKLSEEDIKTIKDQDRTHQQIADDFHVSRELITQIKNNKIWKHI